MSSLVLGFLVQIALSMTFIAVGLLMVFRPATYQRWMNSANVERYAPWAVRGWDAQSWRSRMLGIWAALFGVIATILTVWIYWFQ